MACKFARSVLKFLQKELPTNLESRPPRRLQLSFVTAHRGAPYNSLVFEAARLLGPPARFEASKLKVVFRGEELEDYSRITPRTYTLSHCDRTANLTLTVSSIIDHDQLKGWYNKDDVVAEWKNVMGKMCLHVHCHVSGPNLLWDLAAEFRYHIFCKELPLVLQAILYGDPVLCRKHPELMDALVRVYFHSSSNKYNRVEYWGPLKDAAEGSQGEQVHGLVHASKSSSIPPEKWRMPMSFFLDIFTFLL